MGIQFIRVRTKSVARGRLWSAGRVIAVAWLVGITLAFTGQTRVGCGSDLLDLNGSVGAGLTGGVFGEINSATDDDWQFAGSILELDYPLPNIDFIDYGEQPSGYYTIVGHVDTPDPEGLIVTFGGSIKAISGQTATVNASGNFSLTVQIPYNPNQTSGQISATVVDIWGQIDTVFLTIYFTP